MQPEDATRLRRVVGRLARELNSSATIEGLTPAQASALGIIVRRGPLGVSELAEIEGLNPTMTSRVVRHLSDADLIRRVVNEEDLRSASVAATKRGIGVNKRVRTARDAIVWRCVAELGAEEIASIAAALPALEELVQKLYASNRTPAR